MKWLPDAFGVAGYVAVCAGVFLVAGAGWALIAGGLPPAAFYFWREMMLLARALRRRS